MKKYQTSNTTGFTLVHQQFSDLISQEIYVKNEEIIKTTYNSYIKAYELLDYAREYKEGDTINNVTFDLYNITYQRDAFIRSRKHAGRILVYVKSDVVINFFPLGEDGGYMFTDEDVEKSAIFNLENVIRHFAFNKVREWVKDNLVVPDVSLEVMHKIENVVNVKATTINQYIKYYHKLLTYEECDRLLEFYKNSNETAAGVLNIQKGADVEKSSRNANVVPIPYDNPDIDSLLTRVSSLLKINKNQIEIPQIVKYDIGGEYKAHHDFFTPGNEFHDNALKNGGNRIMTLLVYLNDDFDGGETHFPLMGVVVIPEKGHALLWNNLNDKNEAIQNSLHGGMPVIKGTKYIIPLWIRQGSYA